MEVGLQVARKLKVEFSLIIVRKLLFRITLKL
jgi:predicted phosphoribosyltransferase